MHYNKTGIECQYKYAILWNFFSGMGEKIEYIFVRFIKKKRVKRVEELIFFYYKAKFEEFKISTSVFLSNIVLIGFIWCCRKNVCDFTELFCDSCY